ncbi:MAG TPA: site-2 protease family protein [Planctomycetota bacterium]|nr:site-2 protease family protein [Planctomycetota bacterium]
MNLTFPLFRIFGIQVRVHWFYPILIVMYILRGATESGGGPLLMGFYAGLMGGLLFTTLVHELGHCFGARSVGAHAEQILLWPLGGLAYVGHGGSPRRDIRIAAMGPLMHVPLAALFAGLVVLIGQPWQWSFFNLFESWYPFYPLRETFWANLCLGLFKLQLLLFLFNLLVPAYPLDGGRILTNLLLMRYGRNQAATVTTFFSIPIGIAILVWGFLQRDFLFGLLGLWMLFEAWQIRKLVAAGQIDAHPMFADSPEYDYMPDRPEKKGFLARWREKRARATIARDRERDQADRARVDAVLEKVSREGIGSLTSDEKRILDEASRRSRGDR